jgi:hypothetical protein
VLIARNQVQNFSYNNFGIGERTGTTETHDQAEKVQQLLSQQSPHERESETEEDYESINI